MSCLVFDSGHPTAVSLGLEYACSVVRAGTGCLYASDMAAGGQQQLSEQQHQEEWKSGRGLNGTDTWAGPDHTLRCSVQTQNLDDFSQPVHNLRLEPQHEQCKDSASI
jgi:hypothetical protein